MNGCAQVSSAGHFPSVSDNAAVTEKHSASFADNINDFSKESKTRFHNFKLAHPRFFVFMKHAFMSLVILAASAALLLTNLYAAVTVGIAATGVISSILTIGVATNAAVGCYKAYTMQRTVNFFLQHVDPEQKNDLAVWLFKFDCDNNFINILRGLIADKSDTGSEESYQEVAEAVMAVGISGEDDIAKNIKLALASYGTRFVEKLSELSDKQKKKLTDNLASSMVSACVSSCKALGIKLPDINKLKSWTYSEITSVFNQLFRLTADLVYATRNGDAIRPGVSHELAPASRDFTCADALRAQKIINKARAKQLNIMIRTVGREYLGTKRGHIIDLFIRFQANPDIMNMLSKLQHATSLETFLEASDYSPAIKQK